MAIILYIYLVNLISISSNKALNNNNYSKNLLLNSIYYLIINYIIYKYLYKYLDY
jgi:hydrogenase-4 membrane subunit HyfE